MNFNQLGDVEQIADLKIILSDETTYIELYFSLFASVSNLGLYIFLLFCLPFYSVSNSLHLQNLGFDTVKILFKTWHLIFL